MSMNDLPPPPPSDPWGTPMPRQPASPDGAALRAAASGKLKVPAIFLIVLAALGGLMSVVNVVMSILLPPERMKETIAKMLPNIPPESLKGLESNQAVNIASGVVFLLINVLIIVGSVQAMRVRSYPLAFAASVAAMVNVGSCCCLLTLPVGIWLLVVLLQADVKKAFDLP